MTIFLTPPPFTHGEPVAPAEPLFTSDRLAVTVQEVEGERVEFELTNGLEMIVFPVGVDDLVAALMASSPTFLDRVKETAQRAILSSLA